MLYIVFLVLQIIASSQEQIHHNKTKQNNQYLTTTNQKNPHFTSVVTKKQNLTSTYEFEKKQNVSKINHIYKYDF